MSVCVGLFANVCLFENACLRFRMFVSAIVCLSVLVSACVFVVSA